MKKIKNIIFDYGNVIFDIDFKRAQEAFENLGISEFDQHFGQLKQDNIFDDLDKGKISAQEFRDGIRDITGQHALSDQQITDAWNSLLIGIPEGRHELLLTLKTLYRTFLLSNNNEIHYQSIIEYLNREYRIKDNSVFFEKDYYSHLMGMRKPDAEIFEYVLSTHNLNPEETLFIDDSPQHLKTADQLGLITAQATREMPFEKIIKSFNLLS